MREILAILALTLISGGPEWPEQKKPSAPVNININTAQPAPPPSAAAIPATPEPTDWVDVTWKSAAGIAVAAVVVALAGGNKKKKKNG